MASRPDKHDFSNGARPELIIIIIFRICPFGFTSRMLREGRLGGGHPCLTLVFRLRTIILHITVSIVVFLSATPVWTGGANSGNEAGYGDEERWQNDDEEAWRAEAHGYGDDHAEWRQSDDGWHDHDGRWHQPHDNGRRSHDPGW